MKVGDLVKHNPANSPNPAMKSIYNDWGHQPDFNVGLVVDTKLSHGHGWEENKEKRFFKVAVAGKNLAWYETTELEAINEHQPQ